MPIGKDRSTKEPANAGFFGFWASENALPRKAPPPRLAVFRGKTRRTTEKYPYLIFLRGRIDRGAYAKELRTTCVLSVFCAFLPVLCFFHYAQGWPFINDGAANTRQTL